MFVAFFYLLRQRGLDVSPNEWMTLLEGMEKGLHKSSLTGFYHLCRAIVVKSEVEFDRFDQVFLEFFKDIPFNGELPEEMLEWLEHPSEDLKRTIEELMTAGFPDETMEELLKLLQERLEEQEADVKTIRDLTALVRELNQLAKCDREDRTESLRVQWGEETEQWSE